MVRNFTVRMETAIKFISRKMKIIVNMKKDLCSITSFLSTDIASVGIWDKKGLEFINSRKEYSDKFIKVFEQEVDELKEKVIITQTGSDGNYKVTVSFNQSLEEDEEKLVYKSNLGMKFKTSGLCRFGSPEFVGFKDEDGIKNNRIDTFEITEGLYIVDAYSLLIKNEKGEAEYIEFIFSIWDQDRYQGDTNKLESVGKALSLKYT